MSDPKKPKQPRMRHCFNCGEELGRYNYYDPLDHCGKHECAREARWAAESERAEAHEQLDRDLGYRDW